MPSLKRLSVAAPLLALLFLLPAEAFADNVVITGGTVVMIDGSSASQVDVNLTGANFGTSGSGVIFFDTTSCQPCHQGRVTQFGSPFPGTYPFPLGSTDGVKYFSIALGGVNYTWPDYRVGVNFTIDAVTSLVVPEGNPEVFTFSVQFNMSGGYSVVNGVNFQTVGFGTLSGQGWAEIVLGRGGSLPDGTPLYWARSATYRFAPTAVPEPATLALLGAGVAGLSATLRGKRRVR